MRTIKAGATSQILDDFFVLDSSKGDGSGLPGLAFGTSGLTCYYHRNTANSMVAVTLATMTLGTFAASGFKEVDATHAPGLYQFCPPDAALASGAQSVTFFFQGAANMAPTPLTVLLTAKDPQLADLTAAALLDLTDGVETGYTPRQALRLILSALAAKLAISGNTVTIRDVGDTKNRITATTDVNGQRTAVTLNVS